LRTQTRFPLTTDGRKRCAQFLLGSDNRRGCGQRCWNLSFNAARGFFFSWPAFHIGPLFTHLDTDGLNLPGGCAGHPDLAVSLAFERDFSWLSRSLNRRVTMTLAQVRQ
jgi:hypothetical protein